jgi:hypothetical protein
VETLSQSQRVLNRRILTNHDGNPLIDGHCVWSRMRGGLDVVEHNVSVRKALPLGLEKE